MTKDWTEEEKAIINLAKEVRDSEDPEFVKSVVCAFYRNGGCPTVEEPDGCNGCKDEEILMNSCRRDWLSRIFRRPQRMWTRSFEIPFTREELAEKTGEAFVPGDVDTVGVTCDNCIINGVCPMYAKMAVCGIDFGHKGSYDTADMYDTLIKLQTERVNRAKAIELARGGVPDLTLSAEMDRLNNLLTAKRNALSYRKSLTFEMTETGESGEHVKKPTLADLLGLGPAKPMEALPERTVEDTEVVIIPKKEEDEKPRRVVSPIPPPPSSHKAGKSKP